MTLLHLPFNRTYLLRHQIPQTAACNMVPYTEMHSIRFWWSRTHIYFWCKLVSNMYVCFYFVFFFPKFIRSSNVLHDDAVQSSGVLLVYNDQNICQSLDHRLTQDKVVNCHEVRYVCTQFVWMLICRGMNTIKTQFAWNNNLNSWWCLYWCWTNVWGRWG